MPLNSSLIHATEEPCTKTIRPQLSEWMVIIHRSKKFSCLRNFYLKNQAFLFQNFNIAVQSSILQKYMHRLHSHMSDKKTRHASNALLPSIFYGSVKTSAFSQYQKVRIVNNCACLCNLRLPGDLESRLNNNLFEYRVNLTGSSGFEIGTTVPIILQYEPESFQSSFSSVESSSRRWSSICCRISFGHCRR